VSVFTLALGLTCFILAGGIILFWNNAESHFDNASRTVVISSEWTLADGSESSGVALPLTPHQLGPLLEADFPQIESVARVSLLNEATPIRVADRAVRLRSFAADARFLDIFNLPFIEGDSRSALDAPRSVILTKETAQNLYGDTPAVGRVITLYESIDVTITGVIDRIPEPSHIGTSAAAPLRFDLLVSRDVYESRFRMLTGGRDTTQLPADWFGVGNTTYALLPTDRSFSADDLRLELPDFVMRHVPEAQRQRVHFRFDVIPVDNLLSMAVRDSLFPQQSALSVPVLLLVLGVVVLAIACINFANLATARAALRAKEVGVRKTVGARPMQIVVQHLLEAATLTAAALLIALVLLDLLTPVIRNSTGIDLRSLLSVGVAGWGLISFLLLGAGVTIAAGFYPAFVLSRVPAAACVRAGPVHTGSRLLSILLVGVQFAMAAFLLILLTIVFQQNRNLELSQREIGADNLLVIENAPEIT
ncbi:MAG: ABC transporter permease, partial [Pseudomonadota bacterium]